MLLRQAMRVMCSRAVFARPCHAASTAFHRGFAAQFRFGRARLPVDTTRRDGLCRRSEFMGASDRDANHGKSGSRNQTLDRVRCDRDRRTGGPSSSAAAAATLEATRVIECGLDDERRPTVVTGVAMSPDGRSIAVACDDHYVRVWDAATGQMRTRLAGHSDWVRTIAFSPDGQMLASGGNDRTVQLWTAESGERMFESTEFDQCHRRGVVSS